MQKEKSKQKKKHVKISLIQREHIFQLQLLG